MVVEVSKGGGCFLVLNVIIMEFFLHSLFFFSP